MVKNGSGLFDSNRTTAASMAKLRDVVGSDLAEAYKITNKQQRQTAINEARAKAREAFEGEEPLTAEVSVQVRRERLRVPRELAPHRSIEPAEIAGMLELSERTVQRDWARARAWLHKEIYPAAGSA